MTDTTGREQLLADYSLLLDALDEAETDNPEDVDAADEIRFAIERVRALYIDALPSIAVCPAPNGKLLSRAIDIVDLDGLFWDYQRPARAFASPSDGCIAIDGALCIVDGAVTSAPFLASPGAAKPSVVPSLFTAHNATAVLTSLMVGPHAGFVVAYFATSPNVDRPLLDEWGASEHWRTDSRGDWVQAHRPEHEVDRDFDLERWVDSGHLSWISPDDGSRTLRNSTVDCPFLHLDGTTNRQYVQYGKVWSDGSSAEPDTLSDR